jgi:hypothetical protein
MLASIVLYAFVAERFGPATKGQAPLVFYAIMAVAIGLTATIFFIRRGRLARLDGALSSNQEDIVALNLWRATYVLIFMGCEAIALYGLVLRFLSCLPDGSFYIAFLLLYSPATHECVAEASSAILKPGRRTSYNVRRIAKP